MGNAQDRIHLFSSVFIANVTERVRRQTIRQSESGETTAADTKT